MTADTAIRSIFLLMGDPLFSAGNPRCAGHLCAEIPVDRVVRINHSVQSISMAVRKSSSQVSRWLTRQSNEYYSDTHEAEWID